MFHARRRLSVAIALTAMSGPLPAGVQSSAAIPRLPSGRPDFTGTYDLATPTPIQRPPRYGERLTLSEDEAAEITQTRARRRALGAQPVDPDRDAPPADPSAVRSPSRFAFQEIGTTPVRLEGGWRTSILTRPDDGRVPPMTRYGAGVRAAREAELGGDDSPSDSAGRSPAWWLERSGPGPFDGPEIRPMGERCLMSPAGAGPPMVPFLAQNIRRLVQTDDHLMIHSETVHDVRIVRLGGTHDPDAPPSWFGDSIGRWEGDVLVVETSNLRPGYSPFAIRRPRYVSPDQQVTERFSWIDEDTLLYQFTVEDPRIYTEPWGGEYPWRATKDRIFEYACHEGNSSMESVLRGARLLEQEARGGTP